MFSLKFMGMASAQRALSLSVTAILFWASVQPAAQAIPPGQKDFDANRVGTRALRALVPGTFVTVNNDVARNCVIEFSADALSSDIVGSSSERDFVLVGYTIDSTNPASCTNAGGPSGFNGWGAGTAAWVRIIPRGLHTIRACYGVGDVDSDGGQASLLQRSLTAECRTQ